MKLPENLHYKVANAHKTRKLRATPKTRMDLGAWSSLGQWQDERMRGNGLKLHKGKFRLDIRRDFFVESTVRHWTG